MKHFSGSMMHRLEGLGGVDAMSEKTISQSPYQFAINNPIRFNDPTGLMIDYKNTRGEFTNWNPQLKFEPRWLTGFWDNYWSDPFAAAEMNEGGDYLEVNKNGDIKSEGVFAQELFSGYIRKLNLG